jgi:putative oxidoreductase
MSTLTVPTPRSRPLPAARRPAVDDRIAAALHARTPDLMRWALGLVFVWFGALKIANVTPVADLVAHTLAFVPVPSAVLLPALGAFEVVAGVLLITGKMLRPLLVLLLGHLAGTFLVLVTQFDVAFQDGNPLLLTTEGEFVIKNLVLIVGVLVVAGGLRPRRR